MHGRAEYFDRGSWNKVDDPVLNDFRLSGTCVAGSTELDAGYLIGNQVYKVEFFLKGSLNSISSPSTAVKIQIIGGKVSLRL